MNSPNHQPQEEQLNKEDQQKKRRESAVEKAIREAMERGDFDNLPGKGRPVQIDPTEMADPIGYAVKVRKNAGIGAPWEDLQREIEADTARAQREIAAAFRRRQFALSRPQADPREVELQWEQAVKNLSTRIAAINSSILTFNLKLPRTLPHLHKSRLRLEQFLEEARKS